MSTGTLDLYVDNACQWVHDDYS